MIFDNNYLSSAPVGQPGGKRSRSIRKCPPSAPISRFCTLDDEDALWGEKPVAEVITRHPRRRRGRGGGEARRGCLPGLALAGNRCGKCRPSGCAREKVVDTTAAGDSFSAGYLCRLLCTGGDAESPPGRGHLTASTVIQYRGAITPREAMPAVILRTKRSPGRCWRAG